MPYPNAVAITAQGLFIPILATLTIMLSSCDGGGGTKKATSIPLEPTNLVAKGVNKGIDLGWKAATGAESYTVYYHTARFDSTADGGILKQAGITKTKTIITGLKNGTKYYLRVAAINADGKAKLSTQIVSATAKASATTNLEAPTNVIATGGDKIVDISWDAVAGATSYKIYYHTASFSSTIGVQVKTVQSPALSTSITGLINDTTYYFRAIASNASGSSEMSQIQSTVTKLAPHPSAAASIISPAAVDLSWDAVARVTGYTIYYAKDSLDGLNGGYKNYAKAEGGNLETTTDTSVTIGDLSADTTYYFVVAANYNGKEKAAPEVTADSSYIAELAMGDYHGCVRLNTGSIKCWGRNGIGQLGVGDKKDRNTATSVPAMRAKQLSAGWGHSCAIGLSDRLYCWGNNRHYELGLSGGNRSHPTLVTQAKLAQNVSLVSAGYSFTCALAGGKNYCWGSQYRGGLGNGVASRDPTMDAQEIKNITSDVKQFALSANTGCAIDASNDLWCWGYNRSGQVGDDKSKNENQPSPVKPKLKDGSKATMLDGGDHHYCAVDDDKKVQCWGWNDDGQLGIGSTDDSKSPQYVLASDSKSDHLSNVSKIATGSYHSCAIIAGGKVRCWGWNIFGVIGDATTYRRLIADTDMPINNAIDIAAGSHHACVLLADKARVKCWGENRYGQLGIGTIGGWSATPVEVLGL